MQIIKRTTPRTTASWHAHVMDALMKWYKTVNTLQWTGPADEARLSKGETIDGHRVVFNIKWQCLWLLVYVNTSSLDETGHRVHQAGDDARGV